VAPAGSYIGSKDVQRGRTAVDSAQRLLKASLSGYGSRGRRERCRLIDVGCWSCPIRGAMMRREACIFRILKSRKASRTTTPFGSLKYALEDQRLFQRLGGSVPVEIWSLSPSSASVTRSLQEFAQMVPAINSGKGHLPRQKANDVAVALFLQAGEFRVLLGSDLQSDTASDRGWRAVTASTERPHGRARVFKVLHHGSPNAHKLGCLGTDAR
jgi:hypothetical protein